jgi:hypothetical protein
MKARRVGLSYGANLSVRRDWQKNARSQSHALGRQALILTRARAPGRVHTTASVLPEADSPLSIGLPPYVGSFSLK